jgi:hypothetical protein
MTSSEIAALAKARFPSDPKTAANFASEFSAGFAEGMPKGVTAERQRWKTILASEPAKERPEAARAVCGTDLAAPEAIEMLDRLPSEASRADRALGRRFGR